MGTTKRQRTIPNNKTENYDSASSSSDDDDHQSVSSSSTTSSSERETAGAKKIRMTREYLSRMERMEEEATSTDDEDGSDDDDDDGSTASSDIHHDERQHDKVGRRLRDERLRREGKFEQDLADVVADGISQLWATTTTPTTTSAAATEDGIREANEWTQAHHTKLLTGHDLTCTAVALTTHDGGSTAFSASKDNSVLMWDVLTETKLHTLVPRWDHQTADYTRNSGEVLALDVGCDGRYLAVGGRDASVRIYDVRRRNRGAAPDLLLPSTTTNKNTNNTFQPPPKGLIHTFLGHKGPVTALIFRTPRSSHLFSGSDDRCIRHYDVSSSSYLETLYGHQAPVTSLSSSPYSRRRRPRTTSATTPNIHQSSSATTGGGEDDESIPPVSVGRDRTARVWKLTEDRHLIFRGGGKVPSADTVANLSEDWFVTGHEDGTVALWNSGRKKWIAAVERSHGVEGAGVGRGVGCCAVVGGSDLCLTGSWDGYVRVWKVSTGDTSSERGLIPVQKFPLRGYVNDLAIGPEGRFCVAAVGQEPRLGRWNRVPGAKNRFAIVQLRKEEEGDDDNDNEEEEEEKEEMMVVNNNKNDGGGEGISGNSSSGSDDGSTAEDEESDS